MSLYFVALIPEEELKEEIKRIKEELAEKYNARHALKLPAHITMVIPFKLNDKEEKKLFQTLTNFAEHQPSFEIHLSGFDSFPPRVIFVDVANKNPVKNLYDELQKTLKENGFPGEANEKENFHPHVTIATRDLEKQEYKKAWPHFKNRPFKRDWQVNKLVLLKHNGRKWEIQKEFPLFEN